MQRFSLMCAVICVFTLGCNTSSTPPQSSPSDRVSQAIDDGREVIEKHKRGVASDLDDMAKQVQNAIGGTKNQFKSQAEKKADELSQFAAQMAEDAKDRAIDMPEMVDMMFEPRQRHDTYRQRDRDSDRSNTGSRARDSRR